MEKEKKMNKYNPQKKREYYLQNRDKILKRLKNNYNPKLKKEYNQTYYQDNKEDILNQVKEYNKENREERLIYLKKWRKEHPLSHKDYAKENKDRINTLTRKNRRIRRDTDDGYVFRQNMTSLISKFMRNPGKGISKAEDYLGCSIQQLRAYIESQFKEGMTWENYGEIWEIDHITPCNSFDLTSEEERKICFHYTNMRPLEWMQNRINQKEVNR